MKDEKDAIPELVKWQLKKTQKVLRERNLDETSIHDAILSVKVTEDQVPEQEEDKEIERVCFYCELLKRLELNHRSSLIKRLKNKRRD